MKAIGSKKLETTGNREADYHLRTSSTRFKLILVWRIFFVLGRVRGKSVVFILDIYIYIILIFFCSLCELVRDRYFFSLNIFFAV